VLVLVSAALGVTAWKYGSSEPPHVVRFSFPPPEKRDGRRIPSDNRSCGGMAEWSMAVVLKNVADRL
jgi:hypothetical protein